MTGSLLFFPGIRQAPGSLAMVVLSCKNQAMVIVRREHGVVPTSLCSRVEVLWLWWFQAMVVSGYGAI